MLKESLTSHPHFVMNGFYAPFYKIWTILEADGIMFYSSGFHFVNRLGYLITEEEVEDGVEYIAKIDGADEYQ